MVTKEKNANSANDDARRIQHLPDADSKKLFYAMAFVISGQEG